MEVKFATLPMECTPIWVATRAFGERSETFVARQAVALAAHQPIVCCWKRGPAVPPDATSVPVQEFPGSADLYNSPLRWVIRLLNARSRNYYGATANERRHIRSLIREQDPALILCHFGPTALRMLPPALDEGVPVIAHFHGVDITAALNNRWYASSLKRHINHFAAIVVVAEYQRDRVKALGADPRKIFVIPCGCKLLDFSSKCYSETTSCRFISVGRFVEKKNPLAVIRAFAACSSAVDDVSLTMIGDGPLLKDAKQLAATLKPETPIRFLGGQPSTVVSQELLAADVFVQHSVTAPNGDMEGWPVAIAEAMSAGLPVVSTRHAGIVDQVIEGETGFLTEEHDWQEMAARMIQLARTPALRRTIGLQARARAVDHFDHRTAAASLSELISETIGVHGTAGRHASPLARITHTSSSASR